MLYLFHGSDTNKVRTKAFEWVAAARRKEPNLVYTRLAREELSSSALEDVSLSGGLFVQRLLVLIDDPFPSARAKESDEESVDDTSSDTANPLEAALDALAASDNAIVILAPKLAAPKVKKISAKAKVVYVYDQHAKDAVIRGFNGELVNALASRSREKLWLEINRALHAGDAPEMLHGLLHWKARDLISKGSRSWKPEEARSLSLRLLALLQESRRGGLELGSALERWALSL